MGTGIMGAIPISFQLGSGWRYSKQDEQECKKLFIRHAPKNFFDFYNEKLCEVETDKQEKVMAPYYEIKPEVLLPNFKDFFYAFRELIGEDGELMGEPLEDEYDAVVATNDLDKFVEYFDKHSGGAPSIFPYFGAAYISSSKNLLVYQGSYKALLEEYSSLLHMERLLWAAMDNPLAKVMRIGMSE
jgi:hypothetical protein